MTSTPIEDQFRERLGLGPHHRIASADRGEHRTVQRRTRSHLSNSGDNTVNIGAGGGSITINGLAATDALFFADTFAETGQSIDLHFANQRSLVLYTTGCDPPQTLESPVPRRATRPQHLPSQTSGTRLTKTVIHK
jgi:hypothetical protein